MDGKGKGERKNRFCDIRFRSAPPAPLMWQTPLSKCGCAHLMPCACLETTWSAADLATASLLFGCLVVLEAPRRLSQAYSIGPFGEDLDMSHIGLSGWLHPLELLFCTVLKPHMNAP